MKRTPERQQLMDNVGQAQAYAESDFTIPHNRFVDLFACVHPTFDKGTVLDIGCGNADPTIRFARHYPNTSIIGVDGSRPMINLGLQALEAQGLSNRVHLQQRLLGNFSYPEGFFDALISNSLLHHLEKPEELWNAIKRFVKPTGAIFVMDLTRPATEEDALRMVDEHKDDPELMKQDFYASLLAAYRPEEVRVQLDEAGLEQLHVEVVSNRHMIIHGTRE